MFPDITAIRQPTIVLPAVMATTEAELTSIKESKATTIAITKSETVFPDTTPMPLSLRGGNSLNTPIPLSLEANSGTTATKALNLLATLAISVTTATKVLPQLATLAIMASMATTILPLLTILAILAAIATKASYQPVNSENLAMAASKLTDQLVTLAILAVRTTFYLQQQGFLAFPAMDDNSKDT